MTNACWQKRYGMLIQHDKGIQEQTVLGTLSTFLIPLVFSESGCLFGFVFKNIKSIFLSTYSIYAKIILIPLS